MTYVSNIPFHDALDNDQDPANSPSICLARMMHIALLEADLPTIQRLIAEFDIDLHHASTRPAGLAFKVLKHVGERKTNAQLATLAWFLDQGIYDDNYRLREVVRRMVDSGLNTK